jgi:hypothetical protein
MGYHDTISVCISLNRDRSICVTFHRPGRSKEYFGCNVYRTVGATSAAAYWTMVDGSLHMNGQWPEHEPADKTIVHHDQSTPQPGGGALWNMDEDTL